MGKKAPYINDIKKVENKIIQRYSILTTDILVYSAWEPSTITGRHSTITSLNNKWYGRIGSRLLPPDINKIPFGPERLAAVEKWHKDQYQEAYSLIIEAFPEAKTGHRDMGDITLNRSIIT